MEYNQYLNEILYLIERYYLDEKINTNDLDITKEKIDEMHGIIESPLESDLKLLRKINFLNIKSTEPLEKPVLFYNKFLRSLPNLNWGEIFKIKSNLFNDSFKKKKQIELRFIQIEDSFELAYFENDEIYWIDCKNNQLVSWTAEKYQIHADYFDANIGTKIDKIFNDLIGEKDKKSTKKITISYDYFRNYEPADPKYLVFVPGIIEDCRSPNHNCFTFMMRFTEIIDREIASDLDFNETYYDTFQLCPPYPTGQKHC